MIGPLWLQVAAKLVQMVCRVVPGVCRQYRATLNATDGMRKVHTVAELWLADFDGNEEFPENWPILENAPFELARRDHARWKATGPAHTTHTNVGTLRQSGRAPEPEPARTFWPVAQKVQPAPQPKPETN